MDTATPVAISDARVRLDLIVSCTDQQEDRLSIRWFSYNAGPLVSVVSRTIVGILERSLSASDVPLSLSLPIVRATSSKTSDNVPQAAENSEARFCFQNFAVTWYRNTAANLPRQQ